MEDEGIDYIRLHEVAEGQGLADLLQKLDNKYTKAVVLVNADGSYELPVEFVRGVEEAPMPILVVAKADVARFLKTHKSGFVFARVDSWSQISEVLHEPPPEMRSGLGRESGACITIMLLWNHRVYPFSVFTRFVRGALGGRPPEEVAKLVEDVRRLMFSASNVPMLMAKDKVRFSELMSALYNYEMSVSWGGWKRK
jgi:hypothetical protein